MFLNPLVQGTPLVPGKKPQETRLIVAMSGGVDSSVVAALAKDAGYDVVGLTMQLYDHGQALEKKKACCAGVDIYDAKKVAQDLGFPHYVLDYESRFQASVMESFADSYLRGETPIPCIQCNQTVKFQDLFSMAKSLGGDALATGHYVQRLEGHHGVELHQGLDETRDQSYFLFSTTPQQLSYLRFPLGGLLKTQTRDYARHFGLALSEKPDSQDICFVPQGKYADVVEKLRPGALDPGDIVDDQGHVLGKHQGIIRYTIGQRKGLGLSRPSGEPYYVIALHPDTKQVVVGSYQDLARSRLYLRDVSLLVPTPSLQERVQIRFRSSQEKQGAKILHNDQQSGFCIQLDQPDHGISPGQACVFYDGTRVLGGGWIERTAP